MENNEIQFDEPEYRVPRRQIQRNLFVDFLIKRGWAKDKQQAMYILFGVIGVCILVTFWFFTKGGSEVEIPKGSNIINSPNEPPKLAEPLL